MVRLRSRRKSIRTYSQRKEEEQEGKKFVNFGSIDRSRHPKIRAWYLIIIIFLGMMYLFARFLF